MKKTWIYRTLATATLLALAILPVGHENVLAADTDEDETMLLQHPQTRHLVQCDSFEDNYRQFLSEEYGENYTPQLCATHFESQGYRRVEDR